MRQAYFGLGCFWGAEYYFKKAAGVLSTQVGYMGGHAKSPSYKEVCTGSTGHIEVVAVTYDDKQTNFNQLTRLFFELHDPTQVDRQGPDIGEQYRSVIFYTNEDEKQVAINLIQLLKDKNYDVVTKLEPVTSFYLAETYHQDYYTKTGGTPYCHAYTKRF